jgi:hypothetical protein
MKWTIPIVAILLLSTCRTPIVNNDHSISAPTGGVHLVEDYRVGGNEEADSLLLGGLGHIAVDDEQRAYLTDWRKSTVWIIDSNGELIRSLGTAGEGPGELRFPMSTFVLGDSVFVTQWQGRITVYSRDSGKFVRQFTVPEIDGFVANHVHFASENGLVVGAIGVAAPAGGEREDLVATVSWDGNVQVLNTFLGAEGLSAGGSEISADFLNRTTCAFWDLKFFCGFTAKMSFTEYDISGDSLGTIDVDFDPLPLSAEQKADYLERFDGLTRDQIPLWWPAYTALVAADEEILLIRPLLSRDDSTTTFWILDTKTKSMSGVVVRGNVVPYAVRDRRLYGHLTSTDGVDFVVRYTIPEAAYPD